MIGELDPQRITGRSTAYMGPIVVTVEGWDGVVTIEFKDQQTGERVAKPIRARIAGDDESGEILDRRLP